MKSGSFSTSIKLLINDEINWIRRRIIINQLTEQILIEFKCKYNLKEKGKVSTLKVESIARMQFCYLIKLLRCLKLTKTLVLWCFNLTTISFFATFLWDYCWMSDHAFWRSSLLFKEMESEFCFLAENKIQIL